MKTLELYKTIWLKLTTGKLPAFVLTNGTTLNAIKQIMKDYGYYRPQLDSMGIIEDIEIDIENGYIRKREFSNTYAQTTKQTEFYVLTAKGCKVLYKELTA